MVGQTTPDKVILGLPNYGYQWPTTTKDLHAATLPSAPATGTHGAVPLARAAQLAARYGRHWDADQLVAWTRWRAHACASCPLTWHELYYDDTASMAIKYDLVNAQGLRGVGFWHLNYGADRTDFYAQLMAQFGP